MSLVITYVPVTMGPTYTLPAIVLPDLRFHLAPFHRTYVYISLLILCLPVTLPEVVTFPFDSVLTISPLFTDFPVCLYVCCRFPLRLLLVVFLHSYHSTHSTLPFVALVTVTPVRFIPALIRCSDVGTIDRHCLAVALPGVTLFD